MTIITFDSIGLLSSSRGKPNHLVGCTTLLLPLSIKGCGLYRSHVVHRTSKTSLIEVSISPQESWPLLEYGASLL